MKNRLIQATGSSRTYVALSKPRITYENGEDPTPLNTPLDGDLADDLKHALADAMAELGPSGLAQFLSTGELKEAVTSIVTGVAGALISTTVVANRELTDAELAELADDVIGQYGDGFGEGFEQFPFAEASGVYEYEEEDEDGEVEFMTTDCVDRFFCSLFTPDIQLTFKLK